MKGLMIKDLKLMKNQKASAVIFAAVILFYLFTEVTATIIIGYACIVSAMFTGREHCPTTIWTTEHTFLFTLPFARKTMLRKNIFLTILTNIIVLGRSLPRWLSYSDLHRVPTSSSEYIFSAAHRCVDLSCSMPSRPPHR